MNAQQKLRGWPKKLNLYKFPNAKTGLSGITLREDVDLNDKIEQGHSFTDNCDTDFSKLHLNAKETAYLAVNFIKFIRLKKPKGVSRSPRQSENFHRSQLLQLESPLTSLATQSARPRRAR